MSEPSESKNHETPAASTADREALRRILDEEKLDALAEFAAGAGHEINNPLAIISGHAQILLGQIDHPAQRRHLSIIIAQVKRAYEMIADLRLFSRPPAPSAKVFDLKEFLDAAFRRARESQSGEGVEIEWNPEEFLPAGARPIRSDPAILATAVDELIKNALEALGSDAGGKIRLVCRQRPENRSVVIEIQDNGPGVPAEFRPLLFSPYFSGRSSGRGLGFGLPLAHAMARRLGGELTLAESDGSPRGCRFVLTLPDLPDDRT